MKRAVILCCLATLSACKPPAADEYVERIAIGDSRKGPSKPVESPYTTGAMWADSQQPGKLLYGVPGEPALMALACETEGSNSIIRITRYIVADPRAKALMAMIGNGHIARLPVDALWNGKVWLWEGVYPAVNPELDVLTGPRQIEATIPGAGSVVLNPSFRPAEIIDQCRVPVTPQASKNLPPE